METLVPGPERSESPIFARLTDERDGKSAKIIQGIIPNQDEQRSGAEWGMVHIATRVVCGVNVKALFLLVLCRLLSHLLLRAFLKFNEH
jgi:hypothetical protein